MMQAGTAETDNGPSSSSESRHISSQSYLSDAGRTLFSSLPAEVTSIVFTHFVYSSSSPKPSPLTLGKICQQWRQIAWSTPELWAQLSIGLHQDKSEVILELAEEWLRRSATLPLTISYSSDFGPGRYNYTNEQILDFCRRVLQVLSRHSDRWHSLTLYLPSEVIEELEAFSPPLSSLYCLSLSAIYDDDDVFEYNPGYPRISAFSNCSPRIVKTTCLKVTIDWTFVTSLEIETINIAEVLYILRRALNLSECKIRGVNSYGPSISTEIEDITITHPLLVSFDISFLGGHAFTVFCRAISLPALKHLSVLEESLMSGSCDFSADDFILFLANSTCALESLIINESTFELGSLIRLAPFLSSLAELDIRSGIPMSNQGDVDRDTFYHFLADSTQMSPNASSSGTPLLPSLEIFEWVGWGSFPWNTIPGLLEPLTNGCTPHRRPLKRVSIWCYKTPEITPSYIPKEVIKRLSDFSGVEFKFICDSFFTEEMRIDWLKESLESQDEG